jgi:hypothetical protein
MMIVVLENFDSLVLGVLLYKIARIVWARVINNKDFRNFGANLGKNIKNVISDAI